MFYHQTPDELRGDRSKELPTVTIRADHDEPLSIDALPERSILEKGWQAYSGAMAGEFSAIKDLA
ncbi:hypothetical protein J2W27_004538 [Variovorax boronicumulans]|uniref:hypothetical protein n=1 Tax=Variovorax boronicumulans TaxID=436515 RepID=UPI0027854D96|nr:hypothetical protein [Variovorax boronicumulans]MDP9912412.1 hypothetical protein [Variovorax boronicumulans]